MIRIPIPASWLLVPAALGVAAGGLSGACRERGSSSGGTPSGKAGPGPAEVVARFGAGEVVTVEEFRATALLVAGRALVEGNLPPGLLGSMAFRREVVQGFLDRVLVRRAAAVRGLVPDEGALSRARVEVEEAARKAREAGWGVVPPAAVEELARDRVLSRLLAAALVGPRDEESLFRLFLQREERVLVRVVRLPVTPTSGEIDRFLEENPAAIEAYFHAHQGDFRQPERRRVRLIRLKAPAGGDPRDRLRARRKAERLREQVLAGDDMAALAFRESDDPSARNGGEMLVERRQLPGAWAVDPGQVGHVVSDPEGFWFLRVEEVVPSRDRELDEAVRREIAARLVVEEGRNEEARAAAARAARWLEGATPGKPFPQAPGKGAPWHVQDLSPVPRGDFLPGVGLAPGVVRDLFAAAEAGRIGAVIGPVRVRQEFLVAQVTGFVRPSRETFADHLRKGWAEAILRAEGGPALARFLAEERRAAALVVLDDVLARVDLGGTKAVPPHPHGNPKAGVSRRP